MGRGKLGADRFGWVSNRQRRRYRRPPGVLLRAAGRLDGRICHGRAGQQGERRVLRPPVLPVPGRGVPAGPVGRGGRVRDREPARASIGPYRSAEQPLALDLLHCFGPGMLVLADRKFLSWSLARAFLAADAHILWRACASFALKPVKVLQDGTYLAELRPPRKSDGPVITARVIEYTVHTAAEDGGEETSGVFCLVTDLLDTGEHPAPDLACCYPGPVGLRDRHRPPQDRYGRRPGRPPQQGPRGRDAGTVGAVRRLPGTLQDHRHRGRRVGRSPARIRFPHALAAATNTVAAFPS